jgi:hypothetical protein
MRRIRVIPQGPVIRPDFNDSRPRINYFVWHYLID